MVRLYGIISLATIFISCSLYRKFAKVTNSGERTTASPEQLAFKLIESTKFSLVYRLTNLSIPLHSDHYEALELASNSPNHHHHKLHLLSDPIYYN